MVERQLCNELMFTQGAGKSSDEYMDGHDVKHKATMDCAGFLIRNYTLELCSCTYFLICSSLMSTIITVLSNIYYFLFVV